MLSKPAKVVAFIVLGPNESYQGLYRTRDDAEIAILKDENTADGSVILRCTEAWVMRFPPEPEAELVKIDPTKIFD